MCNSGMSKVSSKVVTPESSDSPVVLACFSAGMPVMDTKEREVKFKLMANSESRRNHQRMLVGENQKCTFVGKNYGEESPENSHCKYIIGIHNKDKKKIQLVEVPHLFALKQYLKSSQLSDAPDAQENAGDRNKQRRDLTNTFGSKKSKQQLKAADSNMIEVENISQAQGVAKKVEDSSRLDSATFDADLTTTVPPHNIDAESPSDAYPLSTVFEDQLWESLNVKFYMGATKDNAKLKKIREEGKTPEYVLNRLGKLSSVNGKDLDDKCRCLSFFSIMWRLYHMPKVIKKKIPDITSDLDAPRPVVNTFMRLFASRDGGNAFKRSKLQMDLLVNYMAVMALHVDDFSTSTEPMASDLKMSGQKLGMHFKAIGCSVQNVGKRKAAEMDLAIEGGSATHVTLSAPLKFPKPSKGKAK